MCITCQRPSVVSFKIVPKLSIIVPVYNEVTELPRLVERFMSAPCPIEREWIFVDDHSADASLVLLQELSAKHHFRVLAQEKNRGKGAAVIRGIHEATGDLIMVQDADFDMTLRKSAVDPADPG